MYATFLLSLVCFCLGESLPVILGCKYNLFWSGLSGETQWMLLKIWTQREIWLDPLRRVRSDKSLSDVYYRQRNIETRHTLHLYTVHIFVYINNSLAHKDTSQAFPPMSRFHVDRRTGCSVFSLSFIVRFTPDFTSSRVIRELKLVSCGGSEFVFVLNASLPYHMLATCAETLPRPTWELQLYIIVSIVMRWVSPHNASKTCRTRFYVTINSLQKTE